MTRWLVAVGALLALMLEGTSAAPSTVNRQPSTPTASTANRQPSTLRVCSDPNNLPYSNKRLEGFENRIAEVLSRDLGKRVEYTWWPQRRGFFRNTLRAGLCDVVIGVPAAFELAATTRPYYRSTYVFVTRSDRQLSVRSLEDPILRRLTIGVQIVGDDGANPPAAHALAKRGIVRNVRGYSVYGDYSRPAPTSSIVDAVARGEIDAAIVWGPQAGYFAKRSSVPMTLTPVEPEIDLPFQPFVYDISMGVRRGDDALLAALQNAIDRRRAEIDGILGEYGVPRR